MSKVPSPARLGFFGGTFDPPHRGHIALARAAADAFALSSVLFVPTGRQPLKVEGGAARWQDRLAMCRLLQPLDPRFAVSAIDGPHPDGSPNYTVDTLRLLRAEQPEINLFSLIGADAFLHLRQWREPRALLALAQWIVVSRPGSPLPDFNAIGLTPAERARVLVLPTLHDEVSATGLRGRLGRGEDPRDLLPRAVLHYIREHNLYRPEDAGRLR